MAEHGRTQDQAHVIQPANSADHLAELVRAWSRLGGAPLPVVVTGAAGMGKSLLVAAALDAFTPRPGLVLTGAARLHTPAPGRYSTRSSAFEFVK
ncbi:hypothetical protein Pa4123_02400 [Phytohabitans aurantiacus]|uniref:Orc1-like AAA ATPase domain-containing protein n=1 Tax=Phytohabitans aurantiacus TaxID=3016789 RepID=A0ABQ5QL27_9ACTN|nr:hypothetical protein Pa4123_02400 [Phytohabitans aurantiacus]